MSKLDTGSYKGVRDFYPEDQFVQNHIFDTWRKVVESFGYKEYSASILEPSELYREKSGEELAHEQTYNFTDRGEREVTLRPELTPTTARMVAGKRRELPLPIRWYSIPNLFRYEAPQRGRLREHWQLNADIFGVAGIEAEVEVIEMAYKIMRAFGAEDGDFLIRLNSRKVIDRLYSLFDISGEKAYKLSKLIDKQKKMSEEDFDKSLADLLGEDKDKFLSLFGSPDKLLEKLGTESPEVQEVLRTSAMLADLGVTNITFDLSLMRGFDYYTGVVFEVFDTNPENQRSLFGGGRYDELLKLFGEETLPACGFGAGDVTMRDFLEVRGLLPQYKPSGRVSILPMGVAHFLESARLADELREKGIHTSIDSTEKKLGDKIAGADKQGAEYIVVIGDEELESKTYKLKNLSTGEEVAGTAESLALELKKESK